MNKIHLSLQPDFSIKQHGIKEPKAIVRIGLKGSWSRPIRALVDTGSPVTIVSPDVAQRLGWKREPDATQVELQGLGSTHATSAWEATMDVAFVQSPAQEPTLGLFLQETTVYICNIVAQGSVVIGQHASLERLRFTQRNQSPFWDFEIALPGDEEHFL